MNNAPTTTEPTTAEILRWFEDVGLAVTAVRQTACPACATPAAA